MDADWKGDRERVCDVNMPEPGPALPMINDTPPRGIIVVDLDGTLCEHAYPDFGPPIAGAPEALQRLHTAGFRIVIHTVRTSSYFHTVGEYSAEINSPEAVEAYLQHHHIPYDEIWRHDKPVAVLYIDDRGVRLVGNRWHSNWQQIADAVLSEGSPGWRLWQRIVRWGARGRQVWEKSVWLCLPWRKRAPSSHK